MNDADTLQEEVTALARELVQRRSVTPDDAGCQEIVADRLARHGFRIDRPRFGDVDNLWARHGSAGPLLVLLGHTDVVPPGPEENWRFPPFAATVADGRLWGRGAADMKGSVAAMVVAAERLVARSPGHAGSIAVLLTSDEEGPAVDGVQRMIPWLAERGETIDYCIVGEPSAAERAGDTIRIGRRGTLTGHLRVHGIQGHVAYPDKARNPIHELAPALAELAVQRWDEGNGHFPPTGFQVSNLTAGTGADNVIPGDASLVFNFRYGTASSADSLRQRVRTILDRHELDYALDWRHGGEPFLTDAGRLSETLVRTIREITGCTPATSTAGGTSDGRFVAATGAQVVEFGPRNATIHQVDEHIELADLATTATVHLRLARSLLNGED